jgi:hypothetical protein
MTARRKTLKRGQRITVPYGAGKHSALVTEVRNERVYVTVDPGSDHPVDTFYRKAELGAA